MFSWQKFTSTLAERRTDWRAGVDIPATIRAGDGRQAAITVQDLTLGGFRAVIPIELGPGERLEVCLPVARALHATVAWRDDDLAGCKFATPIDPSILAALVLACA